MNYMINGSSPPISRILLIEVTFDPWSSLYDTHYCASDAVYPHIISVRITPQGVATHFMLFDIAPGGVCKAVVSLQRW